MRLGRPIATPCRLTMRPAPRRAPRARGDTRYTPSGPTGAARRRILRDAEARRQHAAVDGFLPGSAASGVKKKTGNVGKGPRWPRMSPAPSGRWFDRSRRRPVSRAGRTETARRTRRSGPAGRRGGPGRDADGARERVAVSDDGAAMWANAGHPGEREPGLVPLDRDAASDRRPARRRTAPGPGDGAVDRQRERAADRRVAGHRQLLARREDAHPDVGVIAFGRQDERRFGEGHLLGDPLHRRGQSLRLGKDGELIALEAAIGEDVEVEISEHMDERG